MLTRVTTIAAAVMTLSLLGGCGPSTAGEQDSKKSKDSSVKNSVGSQGQGVDIEGLYKDRPLWPYLLVAAFLTLALEQWVASVGTRRSRRTM